MTTVPTIYLDHAATANPKAPGVAAAMLRSLDECNANPGHGAHHLAVRTTLEVYAARAALAGLLGIPDPQRLAFTSGATAALNLALHGSLPDAGGHVVCSTWEHNAVLRPLRAWQQRSGGEVTVLPPAPRHGAFELEDLEAALRPDTVLCVLNAASNVTGALAPIAEAGELLAGHGVRLLVDGSQVAGHLPLALGALPCDLWACPGHKGLRGPQGIGLLYLRPGIELRPLIVGGGGFDSAEPDPPAESPERYEAGTANTPGILGLGAAACHLLAQDGSALRRREVALLHEVTARLRRLPGVTVFAAPDPERAVGVVSFRVQGWAPAAVAETLDARYGLCVRAGLHCAPLAHRALGTLPDGTVRVSFGPETTAGDIAVLGEAVAWVAGRTPAAAGVPALA